MNLTKFFAEPVFKHDCDQCVWRGVVQGQNSPLSDVYTCEDDVLLRFGNQPQDHGSLSRKATLEVAKREPNSGYARAAALLVQQESKS